MKKISFQIKKIDFSAGKKLIKKIDFPAIKDLVFKPIFLWVVILVEFLIILGLAAWLGTILWLNRPQEDASKKPDPRSVIAQPVKTTNFEVLLKVSGKLEATDSVVIKPTEPGVIKSILFTSGAAVEKDEILIQLDDTLDLARLQEAEAKLKHAEADYERAENLLKRQVGPAKERDRALAQLEMARAGVNTAQKKLEQTTLRAPFAGIVSIKNVSVGAYVKPGEELLTLVDITPIKVDFQVSEIYLKKLTVGQEVEVEIQGFPDNIYTAVIEAIDPVVESQGHSIKVRAIIPNRKGDLKPGLFATIILKTEIHQGVMTIPESAIETQGNQEYVYVVLDGVARKAPIKTGERNGKEVEVTTGLRPGLMVVTAGQLSIQDGYPVTVVDPKKIKAY